MERTKYSEIFLSIVLIIFRHFDQRIGTKLNGTVSKGKTTRQQHFLTSMLRLQQSSNVPWISSIETPIGKTIVDDERANPPCWLVVAIRGSLDASRFSRRVDTLFKIFSKFLFTRMCFLYPNPIYNPPYTRPRRKTESKASLLESRKCYENSYSTLSSITSN